MNDDKITRDSDQSLFYKLCQEQGIEYPSIVHSFERIGVTFNPVYWADVKPTTKKLEQ